MEKENKKTHIKEKIYKKNQERIVCLNKVVITLKDASEFKMTSDEIISLCDAKCFDTQTNDLKLVYLEGEVKPEFGLYKLKFTSNKGSYIECSIEIKKKKREKFYMKEKESKRNHEKIECMNKTVISLENPATFAMTEKEIIDLCKAQCIDVNTQKEKPVKLAGNIYPVTGVYKISFESELGTKIDASFEIKKKKVKYNNKKVEVDGILFDSKREASRYKELKQKQNNGEITDLELQKPFELIPKQEEERAVVYVADFYYKTLDRKEVIEDTKGWRTADYVIKRKLMRYIYGIKIQEI